VIVPILHRILIKQDKIEETNQDYLKLKQLNMVLPSSDDSKRAQAGVDTGVVVALGATAFRDFGTSPPIEVGDKIAYARFAGKFLTDFADQEKYVMLNDEDVCCVYKD
jgi:co-chaperonin GroES (HSP10)